MTHPASDTTTTTADDLTTPAPGSRYRWRIVDIVVGAVLGVATGLIFWAYNTPGNWLWTAADAALPGLSGFANGLWLLGGPLGALVIRRPGAAVFVETLAAVVSAVLGNQWGWSTVWIGIFQGIGAEIAVLAVLYRRFTLPIALLSGALAGVGCWFYSFITGGLVMTATYNILYVVTSAISGAIFAGLLGWLITRGLARAGALQRFTAGRDAARV
ncbi:MAG TPA: ECF transporter S component [Propionibacteriaceae bacterium]|nr:ECF transporter S component [Propionibacteriaceae bacterium]